jgi:hypothetical protein
MDSRGTAIIVFACIFGSAMLGFFLGTVVPERHLDDNSKDIITLSTDLIAMLSALVLGLLVSSAKETFDQANNVLMQLAVSVVLLDRFLAQYGPEAKEIRTVIKSRFSAATEQLLSGDESQLAKLKTPEAVARLEDIQAKLLALTPQNEAQRELRSRAIAISREMASSRWLLAIQKKGSISPPVLAVMVFWLSMVFVAWGVFSPRNLIVAGALLGCALSVSGATFLILEMDRPLTGWIKISPVPIKEAIAHLGE